MSNFDKFVLKKRSVWFHIIVGYLTLGIWVIIYFSTKNKYKYSVNGKLISFHVAGVTFHEDEIKKIIKNNLDSGKLVPFKNYDQESVLKEGENISIYSGQILDDVKLQKYLFKNENAIRVLINDGKGNYIEVGNVPKSEIDGILPYADNSSLKIQYEIVGGKTKCLSFDKNDDEYIDTENLKYGIIIYIK